MQLNDLTWWQDALAGKKPPIHDGHPQCGYFRRKLHRDGPWVPAVIWHKDGELVCRVGNEMRDPQDQWTWLAKNPVTKEAAMEAFKTGEWPDQGTPAAEPEAPRNSNMPSDPFEALLAEIEDKQAQAEAMLAKGNAASDERESNIARNLQKQLLDLKKRADAMFELEKSPINKKAKEIDDKFRFRAAVKTAADRLRDYWGRWARAEEARLRREAEEKAANERRAREAAQRENEAQRQKLMETDPIQALTTPEPELPPEPTPEPVKVNVGGGFGSRGGLRSYWEPIITNYRRALDHYAEHPDVKAVIDRLVKAETRLHKGATNIPGVEVREDRRAA